MINMESIFLIVWFYLYTGFNFVVASSNICAFPKWGYFWQLVFWPVFLCVFLFKKLKYSIFNLNHNQKK